MENKVLNIYSTGNYIYPMMNHNGKGFFFKKCVPKAESLCCTTESYTTRSQLYFNF